MQIKAKNGRVFDLPSDAEAQAIRAALDNPDLPIEFVRDTLLAIEEESESFELGDSSRQPSADKSIEQV